jgi:hypothetical protein
MPEHPFLTISRQRRREANQLIKRANSSQRIRQGLLDDSLKYKLVATVGGVQYTAYQTMIAGPKVAAHHAFILRGKTIDEVSQNPYSIISAMLELADLRHWQVWPRGRQN